MRALFFGWALPASIAGGTAVLILMLATPLLLRFARPRLLRGLCGLADLPAAGRPGQRTG